MNSSNITKIAHATTTGYSFIVEIITKLSIWSADSPIANLITIIYRYMVPVAITLMVGFFVIEIFNSSSRVGPGRMTPDIIIAPILKCIAVVIILNNGPALISAFINGSNSLVNLVHGNLPVTYNVQSLTSFGGQNMQYYTEILPANLSMIGQIIAGIYIACSLIETKARMAIEFALMPLAVAQLPFDGRNSNGIKILKKLMGNMFIFAAAVMSLYFIWYITLSLQGISYAPQTPKVQAGQTTPVRIVNPIDNPDLFDANGQLTVRTRAVYDADGNQSSIEYFMSEEEAEDPMAQFAYETGQQSDMEEEMKEIQDASSYQYASGPIIIEGKYDNASTPTVDNNGTNLLMSILMFMIRCLIGPFACVLMIKTSKELIREAFR